ncbi:MAG: OPT/YSL family transporter, partial [Planctomycetota bacterium]
EGGSSAKTVFTGFGIAFVYQVLCQVFKLFHETIGWTLTWFKGATPALDLNPALLGVGYIIGTRTASIMVAGGVLAYLVFIPAIRFFGEGLTEPLYPGTQVIGQMSDGDLRNAYVLYIGAGAVAAGGIISLLQALPLIAGSIVAGLRDVRSSGAGGAAASTPRTERDLSMRVVLLGTLALIVAIWLALPESMGLLVNFAAAVLIVLFGFLFVTVSSRLTGEIGSSSNPISGMTVATLLLTCLIFLSLSWTDPGHRVIALTVAAIVCVASSQGGTTSQDLKTGYLVGGTPRAQQLAIVVGSVSSALVIGWILVALNQAGTVYTREHAPNVRVESIAEAATRDGLPRQTAPDGKSYIVWNAREGNAEEIPPGKYLLSDDGQIQYLVDPAINGQVKERDDGTSVQKFDAPKTRLMALIIDGILNQKLPWDLVLLGVFISLVVELCGIPSLPFAVGVYLPLSASTPIFAGGLVRWIIGRARRWRGEAQGDSDMSPGALLSTGYIAGGAIAGVLYGMAALSETTSQAMTSAGHQVESALHGLQQRLPWFSSSGFSLGNTIGFLGFLGLAGLLIYVSLTQSAAPEIDRGATGKDNPEP